ncbi:hypothetical protein [Spiroplasma eriocheiris]|uniref:Uncharacterized protein n=1 Tax=Spiroplasma eriocheiris TaxID=315358 RepID=A0A0H3XJ29_9MOLU|nr:hypothetical protein [Spiroplasma eriocheiris]AHF58127.1 hypothetical protein SPE_1012 [Spiroplasma eriocheiris CCTCC M 207170]AKM54565.1 hypothetical protein SERIO_v1c10090 [Spiroplasma eriocheiris]
MKILLSILGAVGFGATPAAVSTNLLSHQENINNTNLEVSAQGNLHSIAKMKAFGVPVDTKSSLSEVFTISWDRLGMSYDYFINHYSTVKLDFGLCYLYYKYGSDDSSFKNDSVKSFSLDSKSAFKSSSEWTKNYILARDYGKTSFGQVAAEDLIYTKASFDGLSFQTEAWVEAGGVSYSGAYVLAEINIYTITIM